MAVLLRLGRRDEARAALAQAIALSPDYTQAHLNLGIVAREGTGEVNILHSAPPGARQEPITTFLQRCNWVAGPAMASATS